MEYKTKMRERLEHDIDEVLQSIPEKLKQGVKNSKPLSADALRGTNLEEYSDKFMSLHTALDSNALAYLNKSNVTGLWVFTDWFYNDKHYPIFLIRSEIQAGTIEWSKLTEELYNLVPHENAFGYNEDFIGVNMDDTITEEIRYAAIEGRLLSIYDAETA